MTDTPYPAPRPDAPVVVFDFDHTLYDGDSGGHLVAWLIRRNPLRAAVALMASVVLGPMVAFLPTRRRGISGYIWIGTFGLHGRRSFDALIDQYVAIHREDVQQRLLPTRWRCSASIAPRAIASSSPRAHRPSWRAPSSALSRTRMCR